MSTEYPATQAASDFGLDSEVTTLASTVRAYRERLRSGELGALPAVLAILVLTFVFGASRPSTFLSLRNMANLTTQAAPVIVIAMAVSFVLLLGEIDLAAGFTAGVTAAVLAVRLRAGMNLPLAIVVSAAVACLLGLFSGFLVARIGIPSFVVTLANFLSFQGILLLIAKEGGSIRFDNKTIYAIENENMPVWFGWVVAVLVIAAYGYSLLRKRSTSGGAIPMSVIGAKVAAVAVIVGVFTGLLSIERQFTNATKKLVGVPWAVPVVLMLVVILTFVLTRTKYGRYLYAVGGNAEAARRAGINVEAIRMSAFVLCSLLAGVGGAFLASQLNSVSPQTGGNQTLLLAVGAAVIGGTSLFGGRGRVINAVLGGAVLALIPNGLGLLGVTLPFGSHRGVWPTGRVIDFSSAGVNFIVSGLVLLLAASVDALSRKRAG